MPCHKSEFWPNGTDTELIPLDVPKWAWRPRTRGSALWLRRRLGRLEGDLVLVWPVSGEGQWVKRGRARRLSLKPKIWSFWIQVCYNVLVKGKVWMGMGGNSETDGARPPPSMEPEQYKKCIFRIQPLFLNLKTKAKTYKTRFCCNFWTPMKHYW